MQALVKYGEADREVEVREVPEPSVQPGTVLIDVRAVGVCGSDIHAWHNQQSWPMRLPVVLGHEIAGVVADVATDVTGWQVGERVVCETAASICGTCAFCRTGRYNLCPYREGYGATRDGAFRQRMLAEPRVLHRIPDAVSFESAAMTEPFCVAYNALVERGTVTPGDLVVIQGAGTIGILAMQIARLRGAGRIVVLGTDVDSERLSKAKDLGADQVVDITRQDPATVIAQYGDGLGADLVVDATGVSAALRQGLELVRPLGSIVKVGWGPQPLDFSLDPLVAKAVTLYGSFSHSWGTWERVLGLFATGALDPQSVIGGVYGLADYIEAFEAMDSGRNIKSIVTLSA